ncbi:Gibberellin-regulated protein 14 [Striga hermonthica]|uniref:Gibberellin-regulated protein 14 n=1 Tax=Striga hermonthica TaxID=68872 RepID=A0A9N7MTH6_STRHE|nr:Gibberellin-regulated protein 14 [Striga hermonthica]
MAIKSVLVVLASFLLISSKVLSKKETEDVRVEGTTLVTPTSTPTYKSSPPPPPPPSPKLVPPPPAIKTPPPPAIKTPPPPAIKTPPPPAIKTPPPPSNPPPPPSAIRPRNPQECTLACSGRCKKHSRQNICMRACKTCCMRCKCVPPGHYGYKELCGACYAGMTTRGGKSKCP